MVCMCACLHMCVHVCYVFVYVYLCLYAYVCMSVFLCVYGMYLSVSLPVCMVCMCVHLCLYLYVYCIYVCVCVCGVSDCLCLCMRLTVILTVWRDCLFLGLKGWDFWLPHIVKWSFNLISTIYSVDIDKWTLKYTMERAQTSWGVILKEQWMVKGMVVWMRMVQ